MLVVRWWQSATIVGFAALSLHAAYISFQCVAYTLGVRSWPMADLWIGASAAISYHIGRAAANVLGGIDRASVHISQCRWLTSASMFV